VESAFIPNWKLRRRSRHVHFVHSVHRARLCPIESVDPFLRPSLFRHVALSFQFFQLNRPHAPAEFSAIFLNVSAIFREPENISKEKKNKLAN